MINEKDFDKLLDILQDRKFIDSIYFLQIAFKEMAEKTKAWDDTIQDIQSRLNDIEKKIDGIETERMERGEYE